MDFSKIQTQIVGVEGVHADHSATITTKCYHRARLGTMCTIALPSENGLKTFSEISKFFQKT